MYEIAIGIISAAVFWFIQYLVTEHLLPRIRGWRRSVPNLHGSTWEGFDPEDLKFEHPISKLEIKQTGDQLRAIIERHSIDPKRYFRYVGHVSSGQLILTWEEPEGAGYIVGAMVLKLSGNLNELHGKTVYLYQDSGKVICTNKIYRRTR